MNKNKNDDDVLEQCRRAYPSVVVEGVVLPIKEGMDKT